MNFELGEEIDLLRTQVRKFLAEHVTDELLQRVHRTGTWHDPDFARALGERGWIAPGWPREEGGEGRSWLEQMVLREEFDRADAPISGLSVTMLVANTIRLWGSEELKASLLPRVVRGEVVMVLGYSEAGSGSDVAAARTSAVRSGDHWVINGEKMFTTHAQVADYVFLLTRTDPAGRKRRNLTMFLVPMDSPGVSVSEVKTLGGERTNITVYTDVVVPDSARVGEVDGAWAVLSSALMFERASTWAPALDRLVDAALEVTSEVRPDGSREFADPAQRARIARAAVDAEASRLLALRAGWVAAQGEPTMSEGPMAKLFSTEAYTRHAAELLDLVGPAGLRSEHGEVPRGAGVIEHAFRHSQVTTIYGGTSEIQRSIIAERGLGLPPEPLVNPGPAPMDAPLQGIRVLDLSRLLPGNYCTLVMAALGADVIKVEDHGAGDYIRRYGTQVGGTGVIDHQVNRGKRSICLDLKDPVERGHFEALVATSNILVESFRPGTLDKLGYPAARLHELRPDLVIASISGFGGDGPLAAAHAHDLNFMALSGLLDRLGEIGGDPQPLPIPLADLLGGMVSAMFTIPYLRRAEATGRGAVIDAPLFEALALMPSSLVSEIVAGAVTGTKVGGRGEFKLGAGLATYAVYPAKDGHVALVAQEAHFWDGLVEVVGLEDLRAGQRDPDAQDEIRARLTAFFAARTKAEIEAAFTGRPACISLLQSYEEMLASPHAVARGYVRTDPDAPVPELALPVTVDGGRPRATRRAPGQGEHTTEILAELGRVETER